MNFSALICAEQDVRSLNTYKPFFERKMGLFIKFLEQEIKTCQL